MRAKGQWPTPGTAIKRGGPPRGRELHSAKQSSAESGVLVAAEELACNILADWVRLAWNVGYNPNILASQQMIHKSSGRNKLLFK